MLLIFETGHKKWWDLQHYKGLNLIRMGVILQLFLYCLLPLIYTKGTLTWAWTRRWTGMAHHHQDHRRAGISQSQLTAKLLVALWSRGAESVCSGWVSLRPSELLGLSVSASETQGGKIWVSIPWTIRVANQGPYKRKECNKQMWNQ